MEELDLILMIAFFVFGVLCVYNAIRLRNAKKLFTSSVLYPGGVKKEDCLDPEGFKAYMGPRIGILGGAFVFVALIYLLKRYVDIPKIASYAHIAFTVVVLIWGFVLYHRAAKQFW